MAACADLQNDSKITTKTITTYKKGSIWADTHLTGLSISPFEDLYVCDIATENERK